VSEDLAGCAGDVAGGTSDERADPADAVSSAGERLLEPLDVGAGEALGARKAGTVISTIWLAPGD
jgi:hypothetical protein